MKKKTNKKKKSDLLYLIIFCILYMLIIFLDVFYIYGKKALICIIIKNIIYICIVLQLIYHYYKKKKKILCNEIVILILGLSFIIFLSIKSINCFYGLFNESTSIITDDYYVYHTYSPKNITSYYLHLNKRNEDVRISSNLYNILDNNNKSIEVTYWHNTEVIESLNFIE